VNGQIQYGTVQTMTSAATRPPEGTPRLAQFRRELLAVSSEPTRPALECLLLRARELGLRDDEIGDELDQIRASLAAFDLRASVERGELPVVTSVDPLAPGDRCHFVCPVRFGRRRSDQFGHLMFTAGWLKFRGALDVSVSWSQIASVLRDGRELIVSLHDSRRVLRFACHSLAEAATGGVIAAHLAQAAHVETAPSTREFHASV
jgi:hypothetical protein